MNIPLPSKGSPSPWSPLSKLNAISGIPKTKTKNKKTKKKATKNKQTNKAKQNKGSKIA
jgi:hypothetical protein